METLFALAFAPQAKDKYGCYYYHACRMYVKAAGDDTAGSHAVRAVSPDLYAEGVFFQFVQRWNRHHRNRFLYKAVSAE